MLRNVGITWRFHNLRILNEVLSLNAQESHHHRRSHRKTCSILNEVLSLNAQEFPMPNMVPN